MGMKRQENGTLAPQRGVLTAKIESMHELNVDEMPDLDLVEYDPLLDSSNIGPADWVTLAEEIRSHYYDYDGFVIIHGTDTLAYTASALSFMLENLGKAVVLTGSLIPICEVYNDARRNLIISLLFAAQSELSEVVIFFNDRLLRGNRTCKLDTHKLASFDSPNCPPLATVGVSISPSHHIWRQPPSGRLRVHTNFESKILVVRITPGFDESLIGGMIEHAAGLRGLVLALYGTGNGPSHNAGFLELIKHTVEKGITVVVSTQCYRGSVSLSSYEACDAAEMRPRDLGRARA